MFNFRYSFYRLLVPIFFLTLFFIDPYSALAFTDNFTSDPTNNPDWNVQNSIGLTFDNPGITLRSTSSSFPFLRTSPTNDLSTNHYHEIVFQYLSSNSDWGIGLSFTDNAPNYPTYLGSIDDYLSYNVAYIFGNHLHAVTSICPKDAITCPDTWWFIYPNLPPTNEYIVSTPRDFDVHRFSIVRNIIDDNFSSYEIYLDNKLISETKPTNRIVNSLWIGHPSDLGTDKIWPAMKIFSVRSLATPPSTFPYLSQNDPLWADKEYDSASQWAGLDKSGIGRWGCALTSAAMILQNYNVQTATGSAVTPDGLNDWLINEPDGYLGLGHVNWLAISRYARESYDANHASTKLEFVRTYPPATPELPAILGLPGHFVVAQDEDTNSWKINDPASTTKQSLDKTATLKSINKFVPSTTDLSYMLYVIDSDVTATLTDDNGETLPTQWVDEYLNDDSEDTAGPAIRTLMIPKPSSGKYHLIVNRPPNTERSVKVYLYDKLGDTTPQILPLPLPTTYFEIQYGSEVGDVRSVAEVDRTPPPVPILLSPADGAHVNTAGLVLDWSDVDDPSAPVTYFYQSTWTGGGKYGPVSTGTNSIIKTNGTPDNTYTWQVQACDSVGNCSDWAQRQLIVDSTQPTVDLVFPSPGPSSNYFEAVFSEPVDPLQATSAANYYLSNWPGAGGSGDLTGDANITYNPDSQTARIVFTNPGWYISSEQLWGVQNITDLAGNMLKVNPYSEYSTQMIAPTLPAPPTTSPNPVAALTQTWSWLAGSDAGSGIAGYSTRIYDNVLGGFTSDWLWLGSVLTTNTNLGEGSWTMSLQARDRAGNTSLVMDSSALVVDVTPPTPPSNLHFDNPSLKCGDFTNSKTITVDWDDASDANGIYGYEYSIDYPLSSGAGRGTWTTTLRTSAYRGSLNEGAHYIKIRAKDIAGNFSSWSNSCAITYDSQQPTLVNQTTFEGWHKETQTSYFDYSDPNMVGDYLAPWCEIATEGTSESCQITPNVCDKAGNCNTTARQSNPAMIDMGKPSLKLLVWGRTLSGTASDQLSGIDKVEIRLTKPGENESTVVATGKEEWSYTINDAPLGHYKAIFVAYDNAGNVSEEVNIEYDLNPASPAQGTNITTTPAPTPSPAGAVQGVMTQRKIMAEEEIDPSIAPEVVIEPTPRGEVLGEITEDKNPTTYWWLLPIIVAVASVLIYLIKTK